MFDCSNNVRTAYISALNGNITYNGINVPVYGQIPFVTTPKNYIVIGDITETSDNNNQMFNNIVNVVIDIFSEQYRINDLSIVDNISNQVLNILIPDTAINGIEDSNFTIYPMSRASSRYLSLQNEQNFIARKIITINNLVNQK